MRRLLLTLSVVLLGLGLGTSARAQTDRPPTILRFASDAAPVTVDALEAGELTATLSWHAAHVGEGQQMALAAYRAGGWERLFADEALPPVGSVTLTLEHPGTFGPPAYRLSILNAAGSVLDERTILIPFADDALQGVRPEIVSFSTTAAGVNAAALTSGSAQVALVWEVRERLPLSNLVFDELVDEGQAVDVELPRPVFWVPSRGTGPVAPVAGADASQITLRLRVLDVISGDVYDEALLTVPVLGTAIPPTPAVAPTEGGAPPGEPPTAVGSLAISVECQGAASAGARGWIEAPGVPSPDGGLIAYVSNAVGEAALIIAAQDGTGEREFPAPNPAFPIGPRVRWSPGGDRLAFSNTVLAQPGGGYVYVLDVDDFEVRQVASYVGYHDDLAWSEDGAYLYFTSGFASGEGSAMQVGDYQVLRVTADGFGTPEVVAQGCAVRPDEIPEADGERETTPTTPASTATAQAELTTTPEATAAP